MGDSFYEYELKYYLLTGSKHPQIKRMWLESMQGMKQQLLKKSAQGVYVCVCVCVLLLLVHGLTLCWCMLAGLSYLADLEGGQPTHVMDHLVCFVPGLLYRSVRIS